MEQAFNRYSRFIGRIVERGFSVVISHEIIALALDKHNPYRDYGLKLVDMMLSEEIDYHIPACFFHYLYWYSVNELGLNKFKVHDAVSCMFKYIPLTRIHSIDLKVELESINMYHKTSLDISEIVYVALAKVLNTKFIISCKQSLDIPDILRLNPYPASENELLKNRKLP